MKKDFTLNVTLDHSRLRRGGGGGGGGGALLRRRTWQTSSNSGYPVQATCVGAGLTSTEKTAGKSGTRVRKTNWMNWVSFSLKHLFPNNMFEMTRYFIIVWFRHKNPPPHPLHLDVSRRDVLIRKLMGTALPFHCYPKDLVKIKEAPLIFEITLQFP